MIAILTVFSLGGCCCSVPAAQWDPAGFRGVPFLAQLFAAASYQLSWSIYVSDYSATCRATSGYGVILVDVSRGFVGGAWMMLVGTVAAAAAPTLDVAAAMQHAADLCFPAWARCCWWGAARPDHHIGLNFYGASLTLLSCADTVRPLRCTVGKRLASLAVASSRATSSRSLFQQLRQPLRGPAVALAVPVTPWTAINLIDFYVVRRGHYRSRDLQSRRHVRALELAWPHRLRGGLCRHDPVLQLRDVHRADRTGAGRADIAMLVGLPVARRLPAAAARSTCI